MVNRVNDEGLLSYHWHQDKWILLEKGLQPRLMVSGDVLDFVIT